MRKNKKIPWKTICFILLAALAGAALGYWGMSQVDGLGIPGLLALLLLLALAYVLQVAVHEGGHLVCGLLTGYRPLFYRIGRIMLVKREGRWRLCRYHIPGTGGQCLMLPPEGEAVPYRLYNWGGGLANLLLAVLAMPAVLLGSFPLLRVFAMALALIGIWMAGTNLIPMQIGGIANDGYNARNLGKDQAALRGYVFQLRANAALLEGRSLSDLPESWFQVPDGADRGNPFVAGIAMQAAARKLELGTVEVDHQAVINGITATYYRDAGAEVRVGLSRDDGLQDEREAMATDMVNRILQAFFRDLRQVRAGQDDEALAQFGDLFSGVAHLSPEEREELLRLIRAFLLEHDAPAPGRTERWEYVLMAHRVGVRE